MNPNRNPFARKPFGRVRRRTNKQKETQRQLQEALAKIEQLKHLEETVKILDADRTKLLEQRKQKEAAEAACRAQEEEKVRIEGLVAAAMRNNDLRDQESADRQTTVQDQDRANDAEPSEAKKPWYRRLFNFQY